MTNNKTAKELFQMYVRVYDIETRTYHLEKKQ